MKQKLIIFSSVVFAIIILLLFISRLGAPTNFPLGSMYTVEKGSGLNTLTVDLVDKKIIKSAFWFKTFSVIFGGTKGIIAGDYVLDRRENVWSLAWRLAKGDYHLSPIKVTLPEGLNALEMSKIISLKFPKINQAEFLKETKNLEGYLFPDTYFFNMNTDSKTIIQTLQSNFQKKIIGVAGLIKSFNKSQSDVIKMASIVELEGRTTETRQIIAGILWKRLSLGMPLQVDSSFKYINGKTTEALTLDDLKIDSPYNSYLYKGLPPTPICNPGLDSIKATITPIKTNYLYFLSDKKGNNIYYAKTYAEHLKNKELYLK